MDDIVKRLQSLNRSPDHDHAFIISPEDVADAIGEIGRLRNELFGLNAKLDSVRSVAGLAVAEPLTFANIKKEIRNGKSAEG